MNPKTDAEPRRDAPATLTGALRLALDDGRALENAPAEIRDLYRPNCNRWHDEPCLGGTHIREFCAGAAMIVGTLGWDPKTATDPNEWPASQLPWANAMHAVNHIRRGEWALAMLSIDDTDGIRTPTRRRENAAQRFENDISAKLGNEASSQWQNFYTWREYGHWLDWAEHHALPALRACESCR